MKSRLISFILLVNFSKLIGGELVKNSASQNRTFLDSFEPVAFRSLFSRRPQQFLRRISDSSSENLLVQMPLGLNCTADDNGAKGYCVDLGHTASHCYDRDVVDSADCDPATHVCCTERRAITVDDVPCGLLGLSIRSPRRPRLPNDPMVNEVCWMASLMGILKSNGMNQHVCDAVIFNSTHVMTPAECLLRVKKDLAKYKRVLAMVGKPVHVFRQSLDFSQPRCGQEYAVLIGGEVFRADGAMLGRITKKGYVFLQVDGNILKDRCTCRVCLPTYGDLAGLTTSSRCYASGFVPTDSGERKKGVKDRSSALLTLDTFRTNLVSPSACRILLAPQKLQDEQTEKIISTLLCSVAPTLGYGRCLGVMGDGLTCVGEHGHHFLVGLSIQPQDCYSAPRLFRNVIGCHDGIDDPDMACPLPQLTPPGFGTCGSPGSNHTDPFGLAFQTSMGKAQRALNVGRRMQMVSSFPVSDAALMGRSAFAESQISNPGLHFQYDAPAICWEVAVVDPSRGHCSGALISSRHVLTAAHCLTEADGSIMSHPEVLRVYIGFDSIPRDSTKDCEVIATVKSIRVHPLYTKPSGTRFYDLNDIALIELDSPVDLQNTKCICTICLSNAETPVGGELCTLSGYGCPTPILASESCPAPRPWGLTWSNVVVLGPKVCSAIPHFTPEAMMCTVSDGGASGCYGDSGGPLVCYDPANHRHYLGGVFSFILSTTGSVPQRCRTQPLVPNFYTKVRNYLPWLIENVPGLEIGS